jgi:Immunity protein 49
MKDAATHVMITPEDTANFIARHDPGISRAALIKQANERIAELDELRESLRERPRNLSIFANEALRLAGLFLVVNPDGPEVSLFLRLLARAVGADVARRASGAGPVQVDLGKLGPIDLPRTQEQPPALLRLRQVVDGYHAALAAGDEPALALLAQAPMERLTRVPPTAEEQAYMLPHALGLQRLAQGVAGGNQLLLNAVNGCESPEMIPAARDAARLLASPEIELALLHSQSDEEARSARLPTFDEALRNALVWHRQYWRDFEPNPGERQNTDPRGFIALGPLAWATLRRNRGFASGITSDYLPRSVIESHAKT